MKINKVQIQNFTAFKDFSVDCGDGLNVIIGGNGTGKTLFLKSCRVLTPATRGSAESKRGQNEAVMLTDYFQAVTSKTLKQIFHNFNMDKTITLMLNDGLAKLTVTSSGSITGTLLTNVQCVYIPPKDITENAPGFRSLYAERLIAYDRLSYDLISALCLPPLRDEHISDDYQFILKKLEKLMGGKPAIKWNDQFILETSFGELDYSLVAEGIRKISLLWLLIKNGALRKDSILFWDEPEANLNPIFKKELVDILFQLVKSGVQVFLSTHDNFLLNEIELCQGADTSVPVDYLAFYRDSNGEIASERKQVLQEINNNCIDQAFGSQYDRLYQVVGEE